MLVLLAFCIDHSLFDCWFSVLSFPALFFLLIDLLTSVVIHGYVGFDLDNLDGTDFSMAFNSVFLKLIHMSSIVENLVVIIKSLIFIHTSRCKSSRLANFQINILHFGVFDLVASMFASIRTISWSPSPGSGLHICLPNLGGLLGPNLGCFPDGLGSQQFVLELVLG